MALGPLPRSIPNGVVGLVAFDLLDGAVTAAIVGMFLPAAKDSGLGADLVGFIALISVCWVGTLIALPPDQWHRMIPGVPLVAAALLGGLGGPAVRCQSRWFGRLSK